MQELANLSTHTVAVDNLLSQREAYEKVAAKVHRIALASSALQRALDAAAPCTQEVAALRVVSEGDPVIAKALALLPDTVHGAKGIPSTYALQYHFQSVAKAARRAAQVPEGYGLFGQAVGTATAVFVVPAASAIETVKRTIIPSESPSMPSPYQAWPYLAPVFNGVSKAFDSVSGMVTGAVGKPAAAPAPVAAPAAGATSGSVSSSTAAAPGAKKDEQLLGGAASKAMEKGKELVDRAEDVSTEVRRELSVLEQADLLVAQGNLKAAVEVLGKLRGPSADAVRDWCRAAGMRMDADRAVGIVRARSALLTASMY